MYKLHHLCDAEITFVLTSGGHNAGIISSQDTPTAVTRWTRAAQGPWVEHTQWAEKATTRDGSWWTAWHEWLAVHSERKVPTKAVPAKAVLGKAPGEYVMQRYAD